MIGRGVRIHPCLREETYAVNYLGWTIDHGVYLDDCNQEHCTQQYYRQRSREVLFVNVPKFTRLQCSIFNEWTFIKYAK